MLAHFTKNGDDVEQDMHVNTGLTQPQRRNAIRTTRFIVPNTWHFNMSRVHLFTSTLLRGVMSPILLPP